jgi:hypothetical protein
MTARSAAHACGRVICPRANTRRVLELTGIGQLVALYDSRDELT